MKANLTILLVLVVLIAGCVSNSSSETTSNNKNSPPPLPDASDASTTADSGAPSFPNPKSAEPSSSPETSSLPPMPAILGLRN